MEWQNMRYSQEFKDNVVARLLSKELSISEAVEQYSIGKSTISYWLKIAREQAVCGTAARCPTKEISSPWPASSSLKE